MTAQEKNLVRRAEKFDHANACAHDQTRQRRFERRFLSLDCPDAVGNLFDYGDCGRGAKRVFRKLDAPYWKRVREHRFQSALWKLRRYPELKRTLRAIRRYRKREKFFSALQIGANVYRERFSQLTKILGILT